MSYHKVFKGLSDRAKELLMREEGGDMDFKRSASAFKSDDLVAFANSSTGGVLLLGVDEMKDERGRQVGKIVGCKIDDDTKMTILNRAAGCFPPIDIEIYVENDDEIPFYRIEIPSGKNKPYCTSGGTYKIRDDGQNKTLDPTSLLELFMQQQSGIFMDRFREATKEFTGIIKGTHHLINNHRKGIEKEIEGLKQDFKDLHDKAMSPEYDYDLVKANHRLLKELKERMERLEGMTNDE